MMLQPIAKAIPAFQNAMPVAPAVNEAYDLDFINYPMAPPPADLPDRTFDGAFLSNTEARRVKLLDGAKFGVAGDLLKMLTQWSNVSELSAAQRKQVTDKLAYGMIWPFIECDTVVNQVFVWLHEWNFPLAGLVDGKISHASGWEYLICTPQTPHPKCFLMAMEHRVG